MISPIDNISNCVYIGNTASLDEQILFNYCSQYGPILSCGIGSCPWEKRFYCDFRIVQYMNEEHTKHFLLKSPHRIAHTNLDVKSYQDLMNNVVDLLNLDRKLFVGPIGPNNFINNIIDFYRKIDIHLQCSISKQFQQTYLLFEFSTRQYIRNVLEQKIIPKCVDHQSLMIHSAINPIDWIKKKILSNNRSCQIIIRGLNEKINEKQLTEYFEKRASIIAFHVSSIDSTIALIELENERQVNRLLESPSIQLNGTSLSLLKASTCTFSFSSLFPNENHPNKNLFESIGSLPIASRFVSSSPILRPNVSQTTVVQPHPPAPPSSLPIRSQPIVSTISEITEGGWSSPPRAIDRSSFVLPSETSFNTSDFDHSCSSSTSNQKIDKKTTSESQKTISQFVEEFLNELDEIKDEYRSKFNENQRIIDNEIHHLITKERDALKKVDRYLSGRRRHSKESNKRKYFQ